MRHAYSKAVTCLSVKLTNRMVVNEYGSCIYLSVRLKLMNEQSIKEKRQNET